MLTFQKNSYSRGRPILKTEGGMGCGTQMHESTKGAPVFLAFKPPNYLKIPLEQIWDSVASIRC